MRKRGHARHGGNGAKASANHSGDHMITEHDPTEDHPNSRIPIAAVPPGDQPLVPKDEAL